LYEISPLISINFCSQPERPRKLQNSITSCCVIFHKLKQNLKKWRWLWWWWWWHTTQTV